MLEDCILKTLNSDVDINESTTQKIFSNGNQVQMMTSSESWIDQNNQEPKNFKLPATIAKFVISNHLSEENMSNFSITSNLSNLSTSNFSTSARVEDNWEISKANFESSAHNSANTDEQQCKNVINVINSMDSLSPPDFCSTFPSKNTNF